MKIDVEALKMQAVEETIVFFKENHSLKLKKKELRVVLDKEDIHIRTAVTENADMIKEGRERQLRKDLTGYVDSVRKSKNEIIQNDGFVVDNSGAAALVNDFCMYSFYALFHSQYLQGLANKVKKMTIEEKVHYLTEVKHNIVFRSLHHCITTICDVVKPVFPNADLQRYFEFFLNRIDFENIDEDPNKEETLEYFHFIYYGLEQVFKRDIDTAIRQYQNGISALTKKQINETQIKLTELIGNFKRQLRGNDTNASFGQYYLLLDQRIKAKGSASFLDYQLFIAHFEITIMKELVSSYEIINETFKEVTPLLKNTAADDEKRVDFLPEVTKTECENHTVEWFAGYVQKHKQTLTELEFSQMELAQQEHFYGESIRYGCGNEAVFRKHFMNIIQNFITTLPGLPNDNPFAEITKMEDVLKKEIFEILQLDTLSSSTPEKFSNWNAKTKQAINKIHSKYGSNELILKDLTSSIGRIQIHVKLLYDMLQDKIIKEMQKENGKVIGALIPFGITTSNFELTTFFDSAIQVLKQNGADPTKTLHPKVAKVKSADKGYSLRQIAIAYSFTSTVITVGNAGAILKKHSNLTSTSKLLQKRISNRNELKQLSGNKTTDSKHLKDLLEAKRLLNGTNDKKAKTEIQAIINDFQASYNAKY